MGTTASSAGTWRRTSAATCGWARNSPRSTVDSGRHDGPERSGGHAHPDVVQYRGDLQRLRDPPSSQIEARPSSDHEVRDAAGSAPIAVRVLRLERDRQRLEARQVQVSRALERARVVQRDRRLGADRLERPHVLVGEARRERARPDVDDAETVRPVGDRHAHGRPHAVPP